MIRSSIRAAALGLALAAGLFAGRAAAQNYPARPVTILVPLAAGTGMDILARLYADKLSAALGQPVVIENKPGAGLRLAAAQLATAAPDGYTLAISTSAPMAIAPTLLKQLPYDPARDFVPISLYVKSPFILVINPELPVKTVPELLKLAASSKPPLNYASVGAGALQHLSMEFTKNRFKVDMIHVPYRSTPQSVQDIAAGHVKLGFSEAGATIPLIKEGKLRALAVSSSTRLPLLPDVPPFSEAANAPEYEAVSWHVLLAPAKTPRPIVDRLHAEMKKIMADPEMQKRASAIGLIPFDTPSIDGISKYMAEERTKWGSLVKVLGLEGTQ
jgi:tripartite-type tricarboxylate transporter receptor subunit TctC